MTMEEIKKRNQLNLGCAEYHCLSDVLLLIEDGVEVHPEQLAAMAGNVHAERRLWHRMPVVDDDFTYERTEWPDHPVCEKYGHLGVGHGNAESGHESFQCVLCGWGFSGYW